MTLCIVWMEFDKVVVALYYLLPYYAGQKIYYILLLQPHNKTSLQHSKVSRQKKRAAHKIEKHKKSKKKQKLAQTDDCDLFYGFTAQEIKTATAKNGILNSLEQACKSLAIQAYTTLHQNRVKRLSQSSKGSTSSKGSKSSIKSSSTQSGSKRSIKSGRLSVKSSISSVKSSKSSVKSSKSSLKSVKTSRSTKSSTKAKREFKSKLGKNTRKNATALVEIKAFDKHENSQEKNIPVDKESEEKVPLLHQALIGKTTSQRF